jgi:ribose transport system substrate-binding protein
MTACHRLGAALVCLLLLAAACRLAPQSTPTIAPMTAMQEALADTRGPNGELPTASSTLMLTDAEAARIKGGHYTAAFSWHTSSDFTTAVQAGAQDEFASLSVDVVATTDAGFSAAKQKNDVETVLAKKPSAIIALPLDPTISAESFRPAQQAGTKLVFLSNVPTGYKQGTDFVCTVTDDLFQMGKQAADVLARSLGGKGKIGWMFHDATNYVTNQRDNAFKTTIQKDYPNVQIVAQQGIADPASAEDAATAMLTQTPDLDGVYVTWAEPAERVLAALRNAGNTRTKLVTLDLSEPIGLDMVSGGNVVGIVADRAYELGHALAVATAYGLLAKQAPPFVVVPAVAITRDNVVQGWQLSLQRDPPASIVKASR